MFGEALTIINKIKGSSFISSLLSSLSAFKSGFSATMSSFASEMEYMLPTNKIKVFGSALKSGIPDSVTSIGDSMFRDCTNLTEIDFSTHNAVPTLADTSAFDNTSASLVIKVPSALLDEWKAATNWSTYADKIVGV